MFAHGNRVWHLGPIANVSGINRCDLVNVPPPRVSSSILERQPDLLVSLAVTILGVSDQEVSMRYAGGADGGRTADCASRSSASSSSGDFRVSYSGSGAPISNDAEPYRSILCDGRVSSR